MNAPIKDIVSIETPKNKPIQEKDSSVLLASVLNQMIELIEAHEITCFSCDRDGERYCDCLDRMVKEAKKKIAHDRDYNKGRDKLLLKK